MGPHTEEGVPSLLVMILPLCFGAGMALIDTLDGILMLFAYGWAEAHPKRRLFYNIYLTVSSGLVAIAVGAVEVLGLIAEKTGLSQTGGAGWKAVAAVNEHFEYVGYSIVGFFVLSMLVAVLAYRYCVSPQIEADLENASTGTQSAIAITRSVQ